MRSEAWVSKAMSFAASVALVASAGCGSETSSGSGSTASSAGGVGGAGGEGGDSSSTGSTTDSTTSASTSTTATTSSTTSTSVAGSGGGGAGGMGGGGGGETCAEDCSRGLTQCEMGMCEAGRCVVIDLPAGTVVEDPAEGDCQRTVCNGFGGWASEADATDLPADDGLACTEDVCVDGMASHPALGPGALCAEGRGTVCDGAGVCVECVDDPDCIGGICIDNVCVPDLCSNGIVDPDETDVDCGGVCPDRCGPDEGCSIDTDCVGEVCNPATLHCDPTCSDKVLNQGETDVDCGGPNCAGTCLLDRTCLADSDCHSGICREGVCARINGCDFQNARDLTGQPELLITFPDFEYHPKCSIVSPGTVVTFQGEFSFHPLTGGTVDEGIKHPDVSSPFMPVTSSGTEKSFALDQTGAFGFYCNIHGPAGMFGAVFVQ